MTQYRFDLMRLLDLYVNAAGGCDEQEIQGKLVDEYKTCGDADQAWEFASEVQRRLSRVEIPKTERIALVCLLGEILSEHP